MAPPRRSSQEGIVAAVSPPLHLQLLLATVLGSVIQGGLTFLSTWGLIPGLDIQSVSSGLAASLSIGLITVLQGVWTAWLMRKQKIINAAADLPEVKKIEVDDKEMADAAPDNVVKK